MENSTVLFNVSSEKVVENLSAFVNAYINSSDRKMRLKARITSNEIDMINKYGLENFKRLQVNQNGTFNRGNVFECIALDYLNKDSENEYNEIKYFGNDTPNILVNESVKRIVIIVNKATCKGAFEIKKIALVNGARLTLTYLLENDLLHELKGLTKALF